MDEREARTLLAFAEEAVAGLRGIDAPAWRDRLRRRYQDLQAAFEWLLDHDHAGDAPGMAIALAEFLRITGRVATGREWLHRALAAAAADDRLTPPHCTRTGCWPSGRAPTRRRAPCTSAAWTWRAGWATRPWSPRHFAGWRGWRCAGTWIGGERCARRRSRRSRAPTTSGDARMRCTSLVPPRRCEATCRGRATS